MCHKSHGAGWANVAWVSTAVAISSRRGNCSHISGWSDSGTDTDTAACKGFACHFGPWEHGKSSAQIDRCKSSPKSKQWSGSERLDGGNDGAFLGLMPARLALCSGAGICRDGGGSSLIRSRSIPPAVGLRAPWPPGRHFLAVRVKTPKRDMAGIESRGRRLQEGLCGRVDVAPSIGSSGN
jgi:hypothetical protein